MDAIASTFSASSPKDDIFNALSVGIDKSIKIQKFFFDQVLAHEKSVADLQNQNIKFANFVNFVMTSNKLEDSKIFISFIFLYIN